jgi:ATP-dependent Clp protease protease subunit
MRALIAVVTVFIAFLIIVSVNADPSDQLVLPDKPDVIFEECECDDSIQRSMQVKNHEGELSHFAFITDGEAHYKLFAGISMSDTTNLWQDLVVLKSLGITKLFIYINSPGGSANDGLGLSDVIALGIKDGMDITTVAVGVVASAAVPVFASGKHRISMPNAEFMVHEAKLGKYLAWESAKDLKTQQGMMDRLRERYVGILVANSKLSEKEWKDKIECTTFFGAEEALLWGLVDEIK